MRRCSVFDAYGVKSVNSSVIQHEVDCDCQCIKTQLETKVFLFHSSLKQCQGLHARAAPPYLSICWVPRFPRGPKAVKKIQCKRYKRDEGKPWWARTCMEVLSTTKLLYLSLIEQFSHDCPKHAKAKSSIPQKWNTSGKEEDNCWRARCQAI